MTLDGPDSRLARLAASLLIEAHTQQLLLLTLNLRRLFGGDGSKQACSAVEGAVGIVAGKSLLVGPAVAHLAELTDEAAFGVAKGAAKDLVPLEPHEGKKGVYVKVRVTIRCLPVTILA